MKKQMYIAAIVFGVIMALAWPVLGAGGGSGGSGGHDGGGHGESGSGQGMGQGGHMMDSSGQGGHMMDGSGQGMGQGGMKIHTAAVDGYQLSYELIDMKARMKGMKNMPEMKHSHHLMVYVKDKDGHPVENATVGYLIEGPGSSEQKAMCMGMGDGYGADVSFDQAGQYTVKTKVVAGDRKLMDRFTYEVK